MKTVLAGVQPSGIPHLGNYLGSIKQQIDLQKDHKCILFIADLHALTTVKDKEKLQKLTFNLAVTYLALGLDPEKTIFFKQSSIKAHAQLAWIFDCITQVPFLERAHAFKDAKNKKKKEITVGLFNYPILMAADILLYQADIIPVGKDQKQHIEMTRDIATKFNNIYGETFALPEAYIKEEVDVVPGVDGQKMSKSYGNTIDIFATEKILKKQIMSIETDSTALEDPKNPETCNVFTIYKLLATKDEIATMKTNYKAGGYGYGHAKKELLKKVLEYFKEAREKYIELQNQPEYVQKVLEDGTKRAAVIADKMILEVEKKIGFK